MAAGSEIASLFVSIGANTSGFAAGMNAVDNQITGLSRKLIGAGTGLSLATAPLAGAFVAATKGAADYEHQMNILQAVSGATDEQMGLLATRAQELGADMELPGTSAADAAKAMVELAKAGLNVNETLDASRGVLQLSAAGQLSNARAAEITANALNAFNLKGTEATRVADLLAAAANSSSAEVTDIADALQMSSAVFASAGIPIEDLTAAIGLMANAGIKGSDAGTSLKTMMMALQAPTDKAANLMAEMGIDIYDASGKMIPFRDIIGQVTTATSGMTQEQRDAALATIFGSDAVRAANVVLAAGTEAFDTMKSAVTEEGAASKLAAAQMKGLSGAAEGFKSQLETLALQVMTPFLDDLEGLVTKGSEAVQWFMDLDQPVRDAAVAFGLVLAAAGPVVLAVGALTGVVGALLSPVGLATIAVAALAAAWVSDFGGIRTAITGILKPIDSFGKYIGAVAKDGDTLNDWLTHLPAPLQGAAQAFGEVVAAIKEGDLAGALAEATEAIDIVGDLVGKAVENAAADAGALAATLGATIGGVIGDAVAWITSDAGAETLTGIAEWIAGMIGTAMGTGLRLAFEGAGKVAAMATTLAEGLLGLFTAGQGEDAAMGLASGVTSVFTLLGTAVPEIAGVFVDVLKAAIVSWGESIVASGPQWMEDEFVPAFQGIYEGAIAAVDFVTDLIQAGKDAIDGFIEGIEAKADALETALLGIIKAGIPDAVESFLGIDSPSKVMRGYGENTMQGLQVGLEAGARGLDMPQLVMPQVQSTDVALAELWQSRMQAGAAEGIREVGRQAMRLLAEGIEEEGGNIDLLAAIAEMVGRRQRSQRSRWSAT